MKNRADVVFKTDRFNLSKVGEHFINECCFGEDLAAWLRSELKKKGIEACEAYQEDWGWEMDATLNGVNYFIGVGGNSEGQRNNPNLGYWRVMVTRARSMKEKLLGQNNNYGELPAVLEGIVKEHAGFEDVTLEPCWIKPY